MKVIIEIEDMPNDRVKVVATPNFETMLAQEVSGTRLSPAQGYAIYCLNQIRQESKRQVQKLNLSIPLITKR